MARRVTQRASAQNNDLDLLLRLTKRAKADPRRDDARTERVVKLATELYTLLATDPEFGRPPEVVNGSGGRLAAKMSVTLTDPVERSRRAAGLGK